MGFSVTNDIIYFQSLLKGFDQQLRVTYKYEAKTFYFPDFIGNCLYTGFDIINDIGGIVL